MASTATVARHDSSAITSGGIAPEPAPVPALPAAISGILASSRGAEMDGAETAGAERCGACIDGGVIPLAETAGPVTDGAESDGMETCGLWRAGA